MERLDEAAESFGLPRVSEMYGDRVSVVVGSLGPHMFGLDSSAFQVLADSVDVIVHNGAAVNFVYPYQTLKSVNVVGTVEVLRLAVFRSKGGCTPVHYISTLSTLDTEAKVISESDEFDGWENLVSGYSQSKWVAERLVLEARRSRGMATSVYRLGRISPSSETGIGSTDDLLTRILKAAVETKFIPGGLETWVDFTPVNHAARVMVEMFTNPDAVGKTFHIMNREPILLSQLWKTVKGMGYKLFPSSLDGWFRMVMEHAEKQGDHVLLPVLQFFVESGQGADGLAGELPSPDVYPRFVFDQTDGVGGGVGIPGVGEELVKVYVKAWVRDGFWPKPR